MQTLEEAIKLLRLDLNDPGSVPIDDLNEAQELAIAGLTYLKDTGQTQWKEFYDPLLVEGKD